MHDCDICNQTHLIIVVDGATRMGPWAYMCVPCYLENGRGLGTGLGQLYIWNHITSSYDKMEYAGA